MEDLSGPQLKEWEAFASIEPLGDERLDYLFAGLMALLSNLFKVYWGEKGSSPMATAKDFIPRWGEEPVKAEQSVEEMKQILSGIHKVNQTRFPKGAERRERKK